MYGAIYSILLGIVLYKLSMMGLLPVSAADYVDLIPPYEVSFYIVRQRQSSSIHEKPHLISIALFGRIGCNNIQMKKYHDGPIAV